MNMQSYDIILASTDITKSLLSNIVGFLLPLVGVALIIFCVINAFRILKGQEGASVKKLVIGAVLLLVIGGIMIFAKSFFANDGATGWSNLIDKLFNKGGNEVNNLVN